MTDPDPHSNAALLDEVTASRSWFQARKTRPIWARQVTEPQQIETLEGIEAIPRGAYLCRGEAGDLWPQTADRLHEKYEATDEIEHGWRKYVPRTDNQGVLAARIDHPFSITTVWGTLKGKPGDYLVKDFANRDVHDPSDLWIVDQKLFHATYETAS